MNHLETLIHEYLEWQGYFVRRNTKVGRLAHGGWEMELDIVACRPKDSDGNDVVVHDEPSIDALGWERREARYLKKFEAAKKYILTEILPWLPSDTAIEHIAVFINHPIGRDEIAGFRIKSIDEPMAEIRARVMDRGKASQNAIPEQYPLLRTLQLSHNGYYQVIPSLDFRSASKGVGQA